ncbi:hypothetical protein [Flavobacterium rhizosphaerae]|uniref:Uncharacterized protein n=1 Tax=Flavobacterium rhizosphaerae TaxID=3163298 RepID=A0ABW8Z067_9FLAO
MHGIDREKSKIRMKILTKGNKENFPWYNFLKENNKPPHEIIARMKSRFMKHAIAQETQVIQFYDNHTGQLLEEHNF